MATKVSQNTNVPTAKVVSSTVWGSIAVLLSWVDDKYFGDLLPAPVEGALIILAVAVAGYFTKNRVSDVPPAQPGDAQ